MSLETMPLAATAGLRATVDAYSKVRSPVRATRPTRPPTYAPIEQGRFYAIDISIKSAALFPAPGVTLGGLRVNEETGELPDEKD